METESRDTGRLRERPTMRFAGPEHVFDLAAEAVRLRTEGHPAQDGHRQVVLFREDPVSLVLFDFDAGGVLPDHVADGIVTILVVSGRAEVKTPAERHVLLAGGVLVLRPGVPHDLIAPVASQVLVSVFLSPPG
jgi:quercetin dioxygenase-like cupin family protein